jgi:hypothetical protein
MDWMHYLWVVVLSSLIASFTDWLFMGVLFHDKYLAHPEVWRDASGGNTGKIVISQLIGVVSSAALTLVLAGRHPQRLAFDLGVALIVWLAGAAPITAQNLLWMKLHPLIATSQAAGWLVRFLITAALAAFLL